MSDFSSFLKANSIQPEIVKYVASTRFIDQKTKKPIEWELTQIDTTLDEQLRKECTKKVPIPGKNGRYTQDLDTDKYIGKLCAACTVYPNLNLTELQDDYGVKDAVSLLKAMLNSGEYTMYKSKVMEVNGYDMSMDELVEEAKN